MHVTRFRSCLYGSILLTIFVLSSAEATAQTDQLKRITLNWNTFKKINTSKLPYIAYTAHKTYHAYRATQNGSNFSLHFKVGVSIDSSQTFVNITRLNSLNLLAKKALLNHEQGHTDLAVIYGRKLKQRLEAAIYTVRDYKEQVKTIYQKTMQELADKNQEYDMETDHGSDPEKQESWNRYFTRQL